MGIDAKDIQLRLCRVLQISMENGCTCLKRHPLVWGALSLAFLLYLLLPYVITLLAFFIPFLLCTSILVRIFWSSEKSQIPYVRDIKMSGKISQKTCMKQEISVNRRKTLPRGTSRRRIFSDMNIECDAETNLATSTPCTNDSSNATSLSNKSEEQVKKDDHNKDCSSTEALDVDRPLMRHSEPSMRDLVACDIDENNNNKPEGQEEKKADKVKFELESKNAEDRAEEDTQEEKSTGVEWTEDEQKNLMDLGILEIERDKRLESLIARRRARKLLRSKIERSLIDLKGLPPAQIAPLLIARCNTFVLPNDSPDFDGLQMPGSAPSIRPARNPFDIPYDPSEEKPDLMGDSFQQEFMAAQQKETMFCRHESFTLGPSFPLEQKDEQDETSILLGGRKASDRLGFSRFRRHQDKGKHEWLIDELLSKNNEGNPESNRSGTKYPNQVGNIAETEYVEGRGAEENVNIDIKGEGINDVQSISSIADHTSEMVSEPQPIKDRSSPSLLTPENEFISNDGRDKFSGTIESSVSNPGQRVLAIPLPKSLVADEIPYDSSSPSAHVKNRLEDRFFSTERRPCHTPTYSIASDLQVEVSEVGSPPGTLDGSNSPTDGESITYDEDIEKDITSGSEEMGGASSSVSGVEEIETNLGDSNAEDDIEEDDGVPRVKRNSKDMTSFIPLLQTDEESSAADERSLSSTRSDFHQGTKPDTINSDHKTKGDVKAVTENVETQTSDSDKVLSPEMLPSLGNSLDYLHHRVHSKKQEDPTEGVQDVSNVDDPALLKNVKKNIKVDNGLNAPSGQRESTVEQLPVHSSPHLSPKSVLLEKSSSQNQVSSFYYDPDTHTDVTQSHKDFQISNSCDGGGVLPDNSIMDIPHNSQQLMDDPLLPPHNSSHPESLQETDSQELVREKSELLTSHEIGHALSNPMEDNNNINTVVKMEASYFPENFPNNGSATFEPNQHKTDDEGNEKQSNAPVKEKLESLNSHDNGDILSNPMEDNNHSNTSETMEVSHSQVNYTTNNSDASQSNQHLMHNESKETNSPELLGENFEESVSYEVIANPKDDNKDSDTTENMEASHSLENFINNGSATSQSYQLMMDREDKDTMSHEPVGEILEPLVGNKVHHVLSHPIDDKNNSNTAQTVEESYSPENFTNNGSVTYQPTQHMTDTDGKETDSREPVGENLEPLISHEVHHVLSHPMEGKNNSNIAQTMEASCSPENCTSNGSLTYQPTQHMMDSDGQETNSHEPVGEKLEPLISHEVHHVPSNPMEDKNYSEIAKTMEISYSPENFTNKSSVTFQSMKHMIDSEAKETNSHELDEKFEPLISHNVGHVLLNPMVDKDNSNLAESMEASYTLDHTVTGSATSQSNQHMMDSEDKDSKSDELVEEKLEPLISHEGGHVISNPMEDNNISNTAGAMETSYSSEDITDNGDSTSQSNQHIIDSEGKETMCHEPNCENLKPLVSHEAVSVQSNLMKDNNNLNIVETMEASYTSENLTNNGSIKFESNKYVADYSDCKETKSHEPFHERLEPLIRQEVVHVLSNTVEDSNNANTAESMEATNPSVISTDATDFISEAGHSVSSVKEKPEKSSLEDKGGESKSIRNQKSISESPNPSGETASEIEENASMLLSNSPHVGSPTSSEQNQTSMLIQGIETPIDQTENRTTSPPPQFTGDEAEETQDKKDELENSKSKMGVDQTKQAIEKDNNLDIRDGRLEKVKFNPPLVESLLEDRNMNVEEHQTSSSRQEDVGDMVQPRETNDGTEEVPSVEEVSKTPVTEDDTNQESPKQILPKPNSTNPNWEHVEAF